MKSINFRFSIVVFLAILIITSCNIEPYEGDIAEDVFISTCEETALNLTITASEFGLASPSDSNYAELCADYKKAIENQITTCGDEDNILQLVLDDLGDCDKEEVEQEVDLDYWPMAIGNKWTFSQEFNNIKQEESFMEIIGLENYRGASSFYYDNFVGLGQRADGKSFENLSVKYYTKKNNGNYQLAISELTAEQAGLYNITQSSYDYIILKDYLSVGGTWVADFDVVTSYEALDNATSDIPDIITKYKIDFVILDKITTLTVGSNKFSNVIKLGFKQVATIDGSPAFTSTVDYIYYFAKDVGIVKVEGSILNADGNITSSVLQELVSYNIN